MVMPTIAAFIPAVYTDALAVMASPDGRILLPLDVSVRAPYALSSYREGTSQGSSEGRSTFHRDAAVSALAEMDKLRMHVVLELDRVRRSEYVDVRFEFVSVPLCL